MTAYRRRQKPIPREYQESVTRLRGLSHEVVAKVTAGCPCDTCQERRGCQVECRRFKDWVITGRKRP